MVFFNGKEISLENYEEFIDDEFEDRMIRDIEGINKSDELFDKCGLKPREKQVIKMIFIEKIPQDIIANKLKIDKESVKTYKERAFEKIENFCMKNNLIKE